MSPTIQQVVDTIRDSVTGPLGSQPLSDTVDTFKCGDPAREVTGIVTTFIATRQVIEQAIQLQANLIITHEPTYFNHRDDTEWLKDDPVYQSKRLLLEDNGIVVWRFHDHWHMHQPDGILTGFVQALGWESYRDPKDELVFEIPETTLGVLARYLKARLGLPIVRVVGKQDMRCKRVGAMLGATPGEWQVDLLRNAGIEVLICGETVEWQTCEYVRDATEMGLSRGLIVLGHEKSEEPGMQYLVEWLGPKFPGIPISHVPAGDPLQFV